MGSGPLADWIQIYDDHMDKIWRNETKELRNLAMIHYAYNKEVTRLKGGADNQFVQIKSALKKKDDESNKRKKFTGLAQSERFELECIDLDKDDAELSVPSAHEDLSKIKTDDFLIESPNTHAFLCRSPSPQTPEVVILKSPVLRKSSFTKPNWKNVSNPAISNPLPCVESKRKNVSSPSILNSLFDKTLPSKRKKPNEAADFGSKQKDASGSSKSIPLVIHKTPKVEVPTPASEHRTPRIFDDSNIMESSIIEDTPDKKSLRKSKRSRLKSKLNKTNQSNTLTQMFLEPPKMKKEFDSKMNSMTVTAMLNLINDSGSETEAELDESDETVDGLEMSNQAECSKAQDRISGTKNKSENCDKSPNKSQDKTNPRLETYDGFWDLTFGPTPESQKEESMILNFKKS